MTAETKMTSKQLAAEVDRVIAASVVTQWDTISDLAYKVFVHTCKNGMSGEVIAHMFARLVACEISSPLRIAFKSAAKSVVAIDLIIDKDNARYKSKLDKASYAVLKADDNKLLKEKLLELKKQGLGMFKPKAKARKSGAKGGSKNSKVKSKFEVVADEILGIAKDIEDIDPECKDLESLFKELMEFKKQYQEKLNALAKAKEGLVSKILAKAKKDDEDLPVLEEAV